jgi:hypothetical protein
MFYAEEAKATAWFAEGPFPEAVRLDAWFTGNNQRTIDVMSLSIIFI